MSEPLIDRPGLFITGTDTGVGKTYLTALIARQLRAAGCRVGVYKPACSGAEMDSAGHPYWPDLQALSAAAGVDDIDRICPQRFAAPLAPPVAARLEQRTVDPDQLFDGVCRWQSQCDVLLVEGVGGWLCPLSETLTIADFAAELGFPVIVVGRNGLGTISHTLLTLEAIERRGVPIAGWLLNATSDQTDDASSATNLDEIARRTPHRCLGTIPFGGQQIGVENPSSPALDWNRLMSIRHA